MKTGAVATNLSTSGKNWKKIDIVEKQNEIVALERQNTFVVKKKSKSKDGGRNSEIPVISPEADDIKHRNLKNKSNFSTRPKKREKTHIVDKEGKRRHSDPVQAQNSTIKGILKQNTSEQLKAELTKPKRHRKSSKGLPPLARKQDNNSKNELRSKKFNNSEDVLPAVLPGVKKKKDTSKSLQHNSTDENIPHDKSRKESLQMSPLSMATYHRRQSMLRVKRHYANLNFADYEKATYSSSSIQSLTSDKEVISGRRFSGVKLESLPAHSVKSTSTNSLTHGSIYAKLWSSDGVDVLTDKSTNKGRNTISLTIPTTKSVGPSRKAVSLSKHPSDLAPTDDIHQHTALVREKGRVKRRLKPIER